MGFFATHEAKCLVGTLEYGKPLFTLIGLLCWHGRCSDTAR